MVCLGLTLKMKSDLLPLMVNEGFERDPDEISAWKWRMKVDFEMGLLKIRESSELFFLCVEVK